MGETQETEEEAKVMGDTQETEEEAKVERQIPLLTMVEQSCVFKMFLSDNLPPFPASFSGEASGRGVILLVGRHPDCDIKMEHPSVSGFHLRIQINSSPQNFCVTDFSSVHGTYVSGERLDPWVTKDLHTGDTLKLGRSSRMYRFGWVPISLPFDENNQLVPMTGVPDMDNEEREQLEFSVEAQMTCVAPNLVAVVGGVAAAKLIARTGSLKELSRVPASSLMLIGTKSKVMHNGVLKQQPGFLRDCSLVQGINNALEFEACRKVASKASLAARIDSVNGFPAGDQRRILRLELQTKLLNMEADAQRRAQRAAGLL